jgi:uncharacterized protein YdaU (DUF1376 family)
MHYYQHNIGDFDKATRHLSRIERSIYRDLIELYYDTEMQLNADINHLCRKVLANSNEESTAVEQVLNEFFTKTPDGWYHDRCEEEIERYKSNISQRAEAGRKSAAARQQKRQRALNGRSTDEQRSSNDAPTNQEPLTNNQEPLTNKKEVACQQAEIVQQVFDYWVLTMGKIGKCKLTADRKRCILARMNEGYSLDHIKQAIDGCKRSEFHMGANPGATIYDDLTLICRSGSQLEKFALNTGAGVVTHAGNNTLSAAAKLEQWRAGAAAALAEELGADSGKCDW